MFGCSICSGDLVPPLASRIDLGIDLEKINEGVQALSVHRVLAHYARIMNVEFVLSDSPLTAMQVFQPEAIMPVVSLEALRIWQTLEHRPGTPLSGLDSLEVQFRENREGFFPLSAYVPAIGSDFTSSLRMMVFCLAARHVLGMVENRKIDLFPLIAQWDKINWDSSDLPEITVSSSFDGNFRSKEFQEHRASQVINAAVSTTQEASKKMSAELSSAAASPFVLRTQKKMPNSNESPSGTNHAER